MTSTFHKDKKPINIKDYNYRMHCIEVVSHVECTYLIAASPHCSAISSKTQMATLLSSGVRSFPYPPISKQTTLCYLNSIQYGLLSSFPMERPNASLITTHYAYSFPWSVPLSIISSQRNLMLSCI